MAQIMELIQSERFNGISITVTLNDLKEVIGEMVTKVQARAELDATQRMQVAAMNRTEVARALGVAYSTLWKWEKSGYLMPVKIGRRVMYKRSDVDRILTNSNATNRENDNQAAKYSRKGGTI